MQFHPGAKPEFIHHVETRLARLREELPALLPPAPTSLTLEIGCGHGHFLTAYAEAHPEQCCLGVDILNDRLERAARKRDRAGLTNLHFHKAEAMELLDCLPAATRFTTVFLLFPDPWPKKRHHKNRLVRAEFLAALVPHMVPGGRFCFRTDHREYFAAAQEVIATHPAWRIDPTVKWPFEMPTVFQLKAQDYQSLVAVPRCGAT